MFQLSPVLLAPILSFAGRSLAQQFPPPVAYDTVLQSPINPNITISYKAPEPGTCATAFSTQKQYSGYVTLPPFTLEPYQQNYSINTFFWFFEARNNSNTAPLTIWLNGGPGSSSMVGLFREAGPCEVIQLPDGSYGTQPNVWGWDRSSNMLFIDQPTQVGFSYDEAVNATVNLRNGEIFYSPLSLPQAIPAWSFLNGTLPSGYEGHTQNSTVIAASATWHFLQGFLSAFSQYNPGTHPNTTTTEPTGVNLFAESYGGQYGPTFADYFEDQNERRRTGKISANNTLEIKLATLGIINGMVDTLIQTPSIASFVFNNTYDMQTIDQTRYLNILSDFRASDGCQERVNQCRERMKVSDPEGERFDNATSSVCASASNACYGLLGAAIEQSGRNPYDIRVTSPSSFPNYAYLEYLNSANVQRSIGAKVNYTETSMPVYRAFGQTGDAVRGTQLNKLADLLARGIRVAFIYGDADIICNWVGGEAVSLELARLSLYNATFPAAGYADIVANPSYVGGQVRQYSNLSFSRIYDAGHTIPSYQPETAFVVFSRIIQGDDIGMGHNVDLTNFGTRGPAQSRHKNKVPPQPDVTCWIRAISSTCNSKEKLAISQGLGVVKNGMWFAPDAGPSKTSQIQAGASGTRTGKSIPTTVADLTGVYTATAIPTSTSGASRLLLPFHPRQVSPLHALSSLFRRRHGDDTDEDTDDEEEEKKIRLIVGLACGLGGLLLLLVVVATCCICLRRRRPRRPKEMPSPLPTDETFVPPAMRMAEPEPRRPTFVKRLTRRSTVKDPSNPFTQYNIERPEEPPVFDRRPFTHRLSAPMEPIPEARSPRPSVDTRKPSPPSAEPPAVVEPTPIVQRNAAPARSPTDPLYLAEKPINTRQPSLDHHPASQTPLLAPEPPEPEPILPVQRSVSLPSEKTSSEAGPTTASVEQTPQSEPDTSSPSRKPALLKRIRTGWRRNLGSHEAAPEAIQEMRDKEAHKNPDAVGRQPTPPPRVATQPPPERAHTVKAPRRAATQPPIEVRNNKDETVPSVKINL